MSLSSPNPVLTFAIRGTQTLFAIVVFGLSMTLIKGQIYGKVPATLGFAAFAGAISFVGAISGIAAQWVQKLQGRLGVLLDAIIAGINLAGGLLLSINLKGVHCTRVPFKGYPGYDKTDQQYKMLTNAIICGGIQHNDGNDYCLYYDKLDKLRDMLLSRCQMSQADAAFLFLTAVVVAGAAGLGYLRVKRGY